MAADELDCDRCAGVDKPVSFMCRQLGVAMLSKAAGSNSRQGVENDGIMPLAAHSMSSTLKTWLSARVVTAHTPSQSLATAAHLG